MITWPMTGKNMYDPKEFVMWLKDQPDHEAHKAFLGYQ